MIKARRDFQSKQRQPLCMCAVLTEAFAGFSAGTLHSSSMSHRGQSLTGRALKLCHLCHQLQCSAGADPQVP